ncbi:glyoxalase [Streptomyces sp. JJ66]|uniref:VOC family protein n=1 Tax=Streptomyces sp. JJ66 TaxID=2803843 RepID=UPI001C56817A|nr:VOC family protein [Streptomyces sp. JJ66]MBW1602545.1 glyoxalase [Streptomyces sp. JJ66]
MTVRRVVPDAHTDPATYAEHRAFYGLLGLEEVMNLGWVMALASPSNPTAQLIYLTHEETAPVVPDLSIEVEDVDAVHAAVLASGAEIIHPLTDEPWGVRRFFTRDPSGRVVNILTQSHR